MKLAVAVHQRLDYLELQVGRRKPIIVLLLHMHDELASESTDCHANDVAVGNPPLDATEQTQEGVTGQDVVQTLVSQQKDALLFLIHVVYFDQLRRQQDLL